MKFLISATTSSEAVTYGKMILVAPASMKGFSWLTTSGAEVAATSGRDLNISSVTSLRAA